MKNRRRIIGLLLAASMSVSGIGGLAGVQTAKAETLSAIENVKEEKSLKVNKNSKDSEIFEETENVNETENFQETEHLDAAAQIQGTDQPSEAAPLSIEEMEHVPEVEDLPEEEKSVIDEAVFAAEQSGEEAAEILNGLDENSEAVDLGIKEVLDTYYSADEVDETVVQEFSQTLEENIEEDIENYTEARAERDNEGNLDYVPGEEIVLFDKDTSKEDIDTIVGYVSDSYEILLDTTLSERKQKRLKALEDYKGNIVVKVNLDMDQTVADADVEFESFDCVVEAESNDKYEPEGLTAKLNDTYADQQWYLDRCNFLDAWDSSATAGCYDIWIGVVDTGCRITHNDLEKGIVSKYAVDVTKKDSNGNYKKLENMSKPYDTEHGTWCTGIISAKARNSIGIAGAARGWDNNSCRVIPIKVSSGLNSKKKPIIYASDMCLGIDHAIVSGAEVVSVSLGSPGLTVWEQEVVERAKAAGVIVVAAAGNANTSVKEYPAALDYVIAVGGTDETKSNQKASFSNYGSWVDIVAPATNYISTSSSGNAEYDGYIRGTSFSTPLVASAIGLMLAVNPSLSVAQIKSILNSTTTDINSSYFSCGMLNAGLAVQKAKYQDFKNSTVSLTSAAALTNNRIKLKWNDLNVYGPEKVLIYRSTSKTGTYSKIKTLTGDSILGCTYTDSGLTAGKTYYYKVRIAMKYGTGHKYTPYSEIKSAKAAK